MYCTLHYVMGKVEMKAYHLSLVLPGNGFVVRGLKSTVTRLHVHLPTQPSSPTGQPSLAQPSLA